MSFSKQCCSFFATSVGIAACTTACAPITPLIGGAILADASWNVGLTIHQIGISSLAGGAAVMSPYAIGSHYVKKYFGSDDAEKTATEQVKESCSSANLYKNIGQTIVASGMAAAANAAGGAMLQFTGPQIGFMAASGAIGAGVISATCLVIGGVAYCCVVSCSKSGNQASNVVVNPGDTRELRFMEVSPGQELARNQIISVQALRDRLSAQGAPEAALNQIPTTAGALQTMAMEQGLDNPASSTATLPPYSPPAPITEEPPPYSMSY